MTWTQILMIIVYIVFAYVYYSMIGQITLTNIFLLFTILKITYFLFSTSQLVYKYSPNTITKFTETKRERSFIYQFLWYIFSKVANFSTFLFHKQQVELNLVTQTRQWLPSWSLIFQMETLVSRVNWSSDWQTQSD